MRERVLFLPAQEKLLNINVSYRLTIYHWHPLAVAAAVASIRGHFVYVGVKHVTHRNPLWQVAQRELLEAFLLRHTWNSNEVLSALRWAVFGSLWRARRIPWIIARFGMIYLRFIVIIFAFEWDRSRILIYLRGPNLTVRNKHASSWRACGGKTVLFYALAKSGCQYIISTLIALSTFNH